MQSRFNILFLSNMMEQKGVWDLVYACHILAQEELDFECHFVGKWSDIDENTFHTKVNSLSLENCIFAHGGRYGSDKQYFFDQANLFILPTYNECFPLVLLEAMQNKLACIATKEGGIPDIIDDGTTGYLTEKNNQKQLATKIKKLISDPKLCTQMGENGYIKFTSNFTIDKFESRMRNILLTCCEN